MKIIRKVTSIVLTIALVITCANAFVAREKVQAADVEPATGLSIHNYGNHTGKYLIYFTPPTKADGYKIFIDDETEPIATISSPGSYVTNADLSAVSAGEHYMKIAAFVTENGVETLSTKAQAKFNKFNQSDTFNDIPQIYIKSGNIGNDYRENNDVSITVVDQNGGSKGLACIDDDGAHKDAEKISKYADIVDNACNIKIRGNTTSWQPKKAWNIKFSGKTSVLGIPKGKKWCLLANSMDRSLMRDMLSYNFGLENGVKYTSQSRYVDVYLNGEYQGNYQLCEPVEAKSNRVEIDAYNATNNDILLEYGTRNEEGVDHFITSLLRITFDVNDPEKGDDLSNEEVNAKIARVVEFIQPFENTINQSGFNLSDAEQYIDVDSFIDYYIANELFKNVDFNFSSTRFYIKGDKLYAGPMWDLDLSSGNCKSSYYTNYYAEGDSAYGYYCRGIKWYGRLFRNTEFVERVKQRYYDLQYKIQSLYRDDSTEINSIKYLVNRYGESFRRNYLSKSSRGAGWSLSNDDGYSLAKEAGWQTWEDPINFLKNWLIKRNAWMCEKWDIDMDEAYAKGKAELETTTPEPTTTPAPTTKETTTEASTKVPTTVEPTTKDSATETPIEQTTAEPTGKTTNKPTVAPAPGKQPTTKKQVETTTSFLGKTKVKKAKRSAKKIKVKLRKVKYADGYQVALYKTKKNAMANRKVVVKRYVTSLKAKIKSKKIKKRKYYIRARAYILYYGKILFGEWSEVKKVKK